MPSYTTSNGWDNHPEPGSYAKDHDPQLKYPDYDHHHATSTPNTMRTRKRWPPSPSVEDEKVSLSREHSPALPELQEGEAQMRGSIDQMPILFEIGKEHETIPIPKKSKNKNQKRQSQRRLSSDDSWGIDTPTDSSASESGTIRNKRNPKYYDESPGSSLRDVLDGQRRPESTRHTSSTRLPDRTQGSLNPPRPAPFHRSASSRDISNAERNQYLYPGTLEELKPQPKEREYLGYAQRQRTMSGSNNAADHRPVNIRHMSAMGYSGESQTPSFQRDHPIMYASPISASTRNIPPEFRRPRERDHNAIITDSSDSDISPDDISYNRHRQRTSSRARDRGSGASTQSRVLPDGRSKRTDRQPSSEPRNGRSSTLDEAHKRRYDYQGRASKRTSLTSSPSSLYPSPPASPRSTSVQDGSHKVPYPAVRKATQQGQRNSRPSSPVGGHPHTDFHGSSNLRYSSRPSSPIQQAADRKNALKPELVNERLDTLQPDRARSCEPSPAAFPRSSRSPRPGLRVDVHQSTTIPAPNTWTVPPQEMKQRPQSSEGKGNVFVPSPTIPQTAPLWPSNDSRIPPTPNKVAPPVKQTKPIKSQGALIMCPRPGFTTQYNDWWTIPSIPDLDLCPDCKDSLQDNAFPGTFIRSQVRAPGTRTRCDMNVSWIRIACLLISSGREKLEVLKDVSTILSIEESCPGRQPVTKKKWYRVYDEDAGEPVSGFNICPACVWSIRTLFPNLKGTFESYTPSSSQPRICDLSASVPRFAKYIDLLDNISAEARRFREDPDTKKFVRLSKDFAGIRPCQRDDQFIGILWHYIPHIPDFTICGECFMEVVRPAQRAGSEIADQVIRKKAMPIDPKMKLSCQLYSPRMRAIFEECCRNQDIAALREHAMLRVTRERELQYHVDVVRSLPEEHQQVEMNKLINEWRRWE